MGEPIEISWTKVAIGLLGSSAVSSAVTLWINYCFILPRQERSKFALDTLPERLRTHCEAHFLLKSLLWSLKGGEVGLQGLPSPEDRQARCEYDMLTCTEWFEKNSLGLSKELRSEYWECVRVTLMYSNWIYELDAGHEKRLQELCDQIEEAHGRIASGEDMWPKGRYLSYWWSKVTNCGKTCGRN